LIPQDISPRINAEKSRNDKSATDTDYHGSTNDHSIREHPCDPWLVVAFDFPRVDPQRIKVGEIT